MVKRKAQHTVYRIYYDSQIVYIGRTNQPLRARIHGHVMAKPMHRTIDIRQITKIEYHSFDSEADMNLYEIYYILLYKPPLNVDDKTKDALTVSLPEVEFLEYDIGSDLFKKWKDTVAEKDAKGADLRTQKRKAHEELSILRSAYHQGRITKEQFEVEVENKKQQIENIEREINRYGWF